MDAVFTSAAPLEEATLWKRDGWRMEGGRDDGWWMGWMEGRVKDVGMDDGWMVGWMGRWTDRVM